MSASQGALSRRHPRGDPHIVAIAALPIVTALLVAGLASAEPQSGVLRLSAGDADRAGSSIRLVREAVAGSTLVELDSPPQGSTLLAVRPDGRVVAVADRVGELSGVLTLAADDGSQLSIPFPGLLEATFASDGSWLAVIDGRGALWQLAAASGERKLLLDGPFIGSPVIADDGSLLLLAGPSVEAPFQSHLVRAKPESGVAQRVSDEELVYGAFPLDGGALAIVAHDSGGTIVRRVTDGGDAPPLDLGVGAVNVTVARNGLVAFERVGEGIFVVDGPGSPTRGIGAGSRPCFARDGTSLLVQRDGQRVALGVDGSVLAVADGQAGFAGSEGCLP